MATRAQLQRIKAAELLVTQCATALAEAEAELREAQLDASSVRINDIVKATGKRYSGEEIKITEIDTRFMHQDRPWVRGVRRKLNGEWSAKVISLFDDWEVK